MKLKDDTRAPKVGFKNAENEHRENHVGPDVGANVVKHAVEEALGVAESVALTSTSTLARPTGITPALNLSVSLREIVEQVEQYLAPEIGAARPVDPEEAEDLDELEIEADIGRPTSPEVFERPPKSSVKDRDWSSDPTRELETPLTHLDTAALEEERERLESTVSVALDDSAKKRSVGVRDSIVDAALDSVLLPWSDDAAVDRKGLPGGSVQATSRLPGSPAPEQNEPRTLPTWEPATANRALPGWYADPETMRYRLQDKLAFHQEGSYFEILELPVDATRDEIETSYRMLAQQFDFEHYQQLGLADLAEGIVAVQNTLAEAYEMLTDDRVREEYRKALVSEE